jgi:hypothetical protein
MTKYQKVLLKNPSKIYESCKSIDENAETSFNVDFSWFSCGDYYFDPLINKYILDIHDTSIFFSIDLGKTYKLNYNTKLIVFTSNKDMNDESIEKFDGFVIKSDTCDHSNLLFCDENVFYFKKGLLKNINYCFITEYSKLHYTTIIKYVGDFPTSKEIDECKKKYNCSLVSKVLYQYIALYFQLRKSKN